MMNLSFNIQLCQSDDDFIIITIHKENYFQIISFKFSKGKVSLPKIMLIYL